MVEILYIYIKKKKKKSKQKINRVMFNASILTTNQDRGSHDFGHTRRNSRISDPYASFIKFIPCWTSYFYFILFIFLTTKTVYLRHNILGLVFFFCWFIDCGQIDILKIDFYLSLDGAHDLGLRRIEVCILQIYEFCFCLNTPRHYI